VSEGVLRPKKLVLLAAPYQFVQSGDVNCGMHQEQFLAFKYAFLADPERALKRFSVMISHNDLHHRRIFAQLKSDLENAQKWEYWLEELKEFSAQWVDYSQLPERVLLVHGVDDVVVDATNTSIFLPFIPQARIELWDKCGHAPHLHDPERLKTLIESI
jgi:pimeloyl-ACP methyl ester carboxylesterase